MQFKAFSLPMINDSDNGSGPLAVNQYAGIESTFSNVHKLAVHEYNVLYKAMRYGRWYLLKGIAPRFAHDEAHRQMLVKEFETMMKLQHPGIVQATSIEEVPEVGFCIVMEYIEGKTLEQWLDGSPSGKQCRDMFLQILDVVEYIHQLGIVHRDLKPSNVMISRVGNQVKIIDFGFADADGNAIFKHAAGTQGYISPEQAAGGAPDVRNDIYSLGAILEKMIPHMSSRYRKVTNRCKDTIERRYDSVAQLRYAITRADDINRWTRIAATMALLAVAGLAFYLLMGNHRDTSSPQTPQQPSAAATADYTSDDSGKQPAAVISQETEEPLDTKVAKETDYPLKTTTRATSRQQDINQAIAEGERKLKAIFPSNELKQNLDTLTNPKYLKTDLAYEGLDFIKSYTESLKPRFSDNEISIIYNSLINTHASLFQEIFGSMGKK